jgi:hypothetical protein
MPVRPEKRTLSHASLKVLKALQTNPSGEGLPADFLHFLDLERFIKKQGDSYVFLPNGQKALGIDPTPSAGALRFEPGRPRTGTKRRLQQFLIPRKEPWEKR